MHNQTYAVTLKGLTQKEQGISADVMKLWAKEPTLLGLEDFKQGRPGTYWVTPEMAKFLLQHNAGNRAISRAKVEEWKQALRTGKWIHTGQTIAINVLGAMNDGQHRLTAIVETGIPAKIDIVGGVPVSSFKYVDIGKRRDNSDMVSIEYPNLKPGQSKAAASAAQLLLNYRPGRGPSNLQHKHAGDKVLDTLQAHPRLVDLSSETPRPGQTKPLTQHEEVFLTYLFEQATDTHLAKSFLHSLQTGANLLDNSPIYFLRERLLSAKLRKESLPRWRILVGAMFLWNSMRAGRSVTRTAVNHMLTGHTTYDTIPEVK